MLILKVYMTILHMYWTDREHSREKLWQCSNWFNHDRRSVTGRDIPHISFTLMS